MKTLKITVFGILLLCGSTAWAAGFGTKIGTLGLGIETTQSLYSKVNTRFGISSFSVERDATENSVSYEQSLKLQSVAALIDWHPFAGGFRVTGGLLLNRSEFELNAKPQGTYDIGNNTYTPNADLKFGGKIRFQPISPYFGIGWGTSPRKRKGWALTAELGVLYLGDADVDLNASGSASTGGVSFNVQNDAVFQENLVLEEKSLENDIDEFALYPVISVGASILF